MYHLFKKDIMELFATILNLLGLVLDITGVIVLFYTRVKGLGRVKQFSTFDLRQRAGDDNIDRILANLFRSINDSISDHNNDNEKAHKKSIKWLWVIIIGFGCQLFSAIIQLVNQVSCNLTN